MRFIFYAFTAIFLMGLVPVSGQEINPAQNVKVDQPSPAPLRSGFYKGFSAIYFTGGSVEYIGGELYVHERKYHNAVNLMTQLGYFQSPVQSVLQLPPLSYQTRSELARTFEYEYGLTAHIGVGFYYQYLDIISAQNIVFPAQVMALILPGRVNPLSADLNLYARFDSRLFKGRTMMASVSYHFLTNSKFDPYVVARVGGTSFISDGHVSSFPTGRDIFQESTTSLSAATALGAGLNLHMNSLFGIRSEATFQRLFLHNANFSTRNLDLITVNAGIFIKLDTTSIVTDRVIEKLKKDF
jgi:opacity protein-like surface antigen